MVATTPGIILPNAILKKLRDFHLCRGIDSFLTSASGQFGKSYDDDQGFFVDDGTNRWHFCRYKLSNSNEDLGALEVGTRVKLSEGRNDNVSIRNARYRGREALWKRCHISIPRLLSFPLFTLFSPKQIGQFEKPPVSIPNFFGDVTYVCNCLYPKSYTHGRLITFRASVIEDLYSTTVFGDGRYSSMTGPVLGRSLSMVRASDSSDVEEITDTLLIDGTELCVCDRLSCSICGGWMGNFASSNQR